MTIKTHYSSTELDDFLAKKHRLLDAEVAALKEHVDFCRECWSRWNTARWDRALEKQGMQELREYLGDGFTAYYDCSWALADEWNLKNPQTPDEVADFYKHTQHYLYNLMIWYESGDRQSFRDDLLKMKDELGISSVIDYGCGVGNDGLYMLEQGFKVTFVDYDCPSTDFLKWRLQKRDLDAPILDVEQLTSLPKADMLWSIDVLEHMLDPREVLQFLDSDTKLFVHRSQFNDTAGGRHPCHFNFEEWRLVKNLQRRGFEHLPWPELSVWLK